MKTLGILLGAVAAVATSASSPAHHHHANVHLNALRQTDTLIPTQPVCPDSNGTSYSKNNETFVIECGIDRGKDIADQFACAPKTLPAALQRLTGQVGVSIYQSGNKTGSFGNCVDLCANTPSCELVSDMACSFCRGTELIFHHFRLHTVSKAPSATSRRLYILLLPTAASLPHTSTPWISGLRLHVRKIMALFGRPKEAMKCSLFCVA